MPKKLNRHVILRIVIRIGTFKLDNPLSVCKPDIDILKKLLIKSEMLYDIKYSQMYPKS